MEKHFSLKNLVLALSLGLAVSTQASHMSSSSKESRIDNTTLKKFHAFQNEIKHKRSDLRTRLIFLKKAEQNLTEDSIPAYLQEKQAIKNLVISINALEMQSYDMYCLLRFNNRPVFQKNYMSHELCSILRELKNSPSRKIPSKL